MINNNKEILYSTPNINSNPIKNETQRDINLYRLIKRISGNNPLISGNKFTNLIYKDITNNKLYLSSIKDIKKPYKDNLNTNYLISKSYDKTNSKYRINTQVENIRNKLYDSPNIYKYDTNIEDNPKYYLNVLNKKSINNLKSYLNNNKYIQYEINSKKMIKPNNNIKNIYDDLNIKELQKLYNDIEQKDFLRVGADFSNNNDKHKSNRYNYENYASNKNIFNHPKLYILDLKERNINKLPKINNRVNEMSIKLDYEKKKNYNIRFQKSYINYIYKTLSQ